MIRADANTRRWSPHTVWGVLSRSWPLCVLPLQCSVTCGQGKTTRQVLCVNFSEQEVSTSECDPDDRPATEQDCAMSQCPSRSSESRPFPSSPNTSGRNNLPRSQSHQWRTGPWGAVRRHVSAFVSTHKFETKNLSNLSVALWLDFVQGHWF